MGHCNVELALPLYNPRALISMASGRMAVARRRLGVQLFTHVESLGEKLDEPQLDNHVCIRSRLCRYKQGTNQCTDLDLLHHAINEIGPQRTAMRVLAVPVA